MSIKKQQITKTQRATKAVVNKEHVPVKRKKQALQTALYNVLNQHIFYGSVIQCLNIQYSHTIPTAGVVFDGDNKRWNMLINPHWFCNLINDKERIGVLIHELSHLTHKHPLRVPFMKLNDQQRYIMNIAMDMAINQYIKNLPSGCKQCKNKEPSYECSNEKCPGRAININDYFTVVNGKKVPWNKLETTEYYYDKLLEKFKHVNHTGGDCPIHGNNSNKDVNDNNSNKDVNDNNGQTADNNKKTNGSNGQTADHQQKRCTCKQGNNELPKEFDSHQWDGNGDEQEMLDATEELVKRAMQKNSISHTSLPTHVKELLEYIDTRRVELDYKSLLLAAIKRHASGIDREYSWLRKSRRFGNKAPGTRLGNLPKLDTYIDTSGSISIEEANEFLEVIDNFLKVGSRRCDINLWHTSVYYSEKYRVGVPISRDAWENGGTCLKGVLRQIHKKQPDLAIILTDGYFSDINYEQWLRPNEKFPQVLWIISRQGTAKHPLSRLGNTIQIPEATIKLNSAS